MLGNSFPFAKAVHRYIRICHIYPATDTIFAGYRICSSDPFEGEAIGNFFLCEFPIGASTDEAEATVRAGYQTAFFESGVGR